MIALDARRGARIERSSDSCKPVNLSRCSTYNLSWCFLTQIRNSGATVQERPDYSSERAWVQKRKSVVRCLWTQEFKMRYDASRISVFTSLRLPGWSRGFGVPPPVKGPWVRLRTVTFSGSDTRSRCQRFGFPRRFGLSGGISGPRFRLVAAS